MIMTMEAITGTCFVWRQATIMPFGATCGSSIDMLPGDAEPFWGLNCDHRKFYFYLIELLTFFANLFVAPIVASGMETKRTARTKITMVR
jgi:hypothetical protein